MEKKNAPGFSYAAAGISIDATDTTKKAIGSSLATGDPRVLNSIGAFGALYDGHFPDMAHPVLVMKTEEPGSKQKLAAEKGMLASVCADMINHLVNDIAVMGARPLAVQDCIVLGEHNDERIRTLVEGIASACRANDCSLTGGETSIQPGVLDAGTFILSSSIVGIVDKAHVLDGNRIREGDEVIALASNGPHTNGYTLIRKLMDHFPDLAGSRCGDVTFFDAIMRPHTPYYKIIRELFLDPRLHGLAHITGGGIQDNLNRILPAGLNALIDRSAIQMPEVFRVIRARGEVDEAEMLRTFNCGVGLCLVVAEGSASECVAVLERASRTSHEGTVPPGHSGAVRAYRIGTIAKSVPNGPDRSIVFSGKLMA